MMPVVRAPAEIAMSMHHLDAGNPAEIALVAERMRDTLIESASSTRVRMTSPAPA